MTVPDLIIAGLLVAGVAFYAYWRRKMQDRFGEAHAAYNANAFQEVVSPSPDERYVYVTRLATEYETKKGIRAVMMASTRRGIALHQINKDGSFSAKGPYFVSWYSRNWHPTGNTHLIKVLRGKGRWGFSPDHYNQTGHITEKGICIVECNTKLNRPLTLDEFIDHEVKV